MSKLICEINKLDIPTLVSSFFSVYNESEIIVLLERILSETGTGKNDLGIEFSRDAQEWGEQPFDGVKFYLLNEEITISNQDFIKYLEEVCKVYENEYPIKKEEIETLFTKIREKF